MLPSFLLAAVECVLGKGEMEGGRGVVNRGVGFLLEVRERKQLLKMLGTQLNNG